jgi:hypothetical protein
VVLTAEDREFERQIYDLHQVFFPRPHWRDPSPFSSDEVLELLTLMLAAQERGFFKRSEELIQTHRFKRPRSFAALPPSEAALWQVAANRRGADDLKDETWSALQHLRKCFPGAPLEGHDGGLPYCYVAPQQGIIVTAGNLSPTLILKYMVQRCTPRLGIVAAQMIPAPRFGPDQVECTGRLCLQWLEFAPPAFAVLQEHYAALARAFENRQARRYGTANVDQGVSL